MQMLCRLKRGKQFLGVFIQLTSVNHLRIEFAKLYLAFKVYVHTEMFCSATKSFSLHVMLFYVLQSIVRPSCAIQLVFFAQEFGCVFSEFMAIVCVLCGMRAVAHLEKVFCAEQAAVFMRCERGSARLHAHLVKPPIHSHNPHATPPAWVYHCSPNFTPQSLRFYQFGHIIVSQLAL